MVRSLSATACANACAAIIAETNARQQIAATLLGHVHFLTPSEIEFARRVPPKDPDRAWQLWKQKAMHGEG